MNAQGAYSLAFWLRVNTPAAFNAILRAHSGGRLGGCGCGGGRLGQDTSMTVDASGGDGSAIPPNLIDNNPDASLTPPNLQFDILDPGQLQPISVDLTQIPPPETPSVTPDPPVPTDTSTGALTAVATGIARALPAALGLATAVTQNETARVVTQAQFARVAAGYNPAAISYTVNPATGQVMPVMASSGGVALPVNSGLLSALAPNAATLQVGSFLSQNILWIALALGALLLIRR